MKNLYVNEIKKIDKPYLIDVREKDEQAYGMIPGAISMPLMTIPEKLNSLPKDKTIYVVCESGGRSFNACEFLANRGFDCVNLLGGMSLYEGDLVK